MGKKWLIWLLGISLLLGMLPSGTGFAEAEAAEEEYGLTLLRIREGDEESLEYALKDAAGNYYLSSRTLERYTGYVFDREKMLFRRYEDDAYDSQRKLIRFTQQADGSLSMQVRSYAVTLPGAPVYRGLYYFPLAYLFPVMDTVVSAEEGALVLEHPAVTFVDAFHGLRLPDLMFTQEKELGGSIVAGGLITVPSYLFDTIRNFRIDRVTPVGKVRDYTIAMTELLTDRDAYEAVFADRDRSALEEEAGLVSSLLKADHLSFKAIKLIRQLSEFTEHEEEFLEVMPEEIYGSLESLAKGAKYGRMVISTASTFGLMLKDNRDMFQVVYLNKRPDYVYQNDTLLRKYLENHSEELLDRVLEKSSPREVAAHRMVRVYSNKDIAHMAYQLGEQVIVDLADDALESGLVALTGSSAWEALAVKLAGEGMNAWLKEIGITDTEGAALLYYYMDLVLDGEEMFRKYEEQYQYRAESIRNLRLSALQTLLASKKCYEIMQANTPATSTDRLDIEYRNYCQNRIDTISQRIGLLYLSGEGTLCDGQEYFEDATAFLKNEQILFREETEPEGVRTYRELLRSYEGIRHTARLQDLDGDGRQELILAVYDDPAGEAEYSGFLGVSYLRVYSVADGTLTQTYEADYSNAHTVEAVVALTENPEGQIGLLDVQITNWQGDCNAALQFTDFRGNLYENANVLATSEYNEAERPAFDLFHPEAVLEPFMPLLTAVSGYPAMQDGTILRSLIFDKSGNWLQEEKTLGFGFLEEEDAWS